MVVASAILLGVFVLRALPYHADTVCCTHCNDAVLGTDTAKAWFDLPLEQFSWTLRTCFNQLVKLDLTGCRNWVNDFELNRIGESKPQLTELLLDHCSNISKASMVSLGKHCPGLKMLSLRHIKTVEDDWLADIAESMPALELLNIAKCTRVGNAGIRWFATVQHASLRILDISDCQRIGIRVFENEVFDVCPQLQEVRVSRCKKFADCFSIYRYANRGDDANVLELLDARTHWFTR